MTNPLSAEALNVVIAIVALNEAHNLVGCLTSLAASSHRHFHVVICENGGEAGFERTTQALAALSILREASAGDPTEIEIVSRLPHRDYTFVGGGQWVTVLKAPANLGYGGGVNACIAALGKTGWDAVWVLNADTFPEPGTLAALTRRQKEGDYGIVGTRTLSVASGRVQTWGGIRWRPWLGRGSLLGENQPADTVPDIAALERRFGFISGASMFVARAYIETVGLMDEDFFLYCEDLDWCLRRGTFRLGYAHDAVLRHVHGATTGSSLVKRDRSRLNIYLMERNRILLARKRFGRWWGLAALLALAQTPEYLVRVRSLRQFSIALQGWWAGISGETGAPAFLGEARRQAGP